ncbi:MAG: hypothetical protein QOD14_1998 [Solirubrobacterales bacterium]|nr:hypothetical protein [Solirubrobacterales bacterium]
MSLRARARISPEDLAWLGSIAAAAFLVIGFVWITPALAKLYPSPDQTLFAVWRHYGAPEPLEDVRGMVTLATPFVVASALLLLGSRVPGRRSLDPLILGTQVTGIALLTWSVLNQRHVVILVPRDYFEPLVLGVPNLIAGVCMGVVMTGLILWWAGPAPRPLERIGGWLARRPVLAAAAAVLATTVFLLPAVVTDASIAHSGSLASQISPPAEDYMAVINGRTPLVDYIAQYANLLPFAVAPLLSAFDSSLTAYSIIMCMLSGIGLLAVFGVFSAVTRRTWVALALYVPFLALALFPWHDQGAARDFNGNYYAMCPDRILGPFVLAWLCALWTRGRRVPVWALYLIAGLTLLNNSEFGVGALIALTVAILAGAPREAASRPSWARMGLEAAAGLASAVVIVSVVTLARTSDLPDPALLTYYSHLFLREAYALLPMPSLGLQWALYATFAAALLMAVARWVQRASDRTLTAMLAFSGCFGLITGMYFVGRSVPAQLIILFPIWGFCLVIVAWSAALALRSTRTDWMRLRRLLLPAAAALIGFGVMVAAIDRTPPPWRQLDRLTDGGRAVDDAPNAQRFIEARTDPGDSVLVLGTPLAHRLADRSGVANVSPLNGLVSLISPAEADRSIDQLQASGGQEVFEAATAQSAINPTLIKIPEFATILQHRGYRLVEQDPSSGLRLWRRTGSTAGSKQ